MAKAVGTPDPALPSSRVTHERSIYFKKTLPSSRVTHALCFLRVSLPSIRIEIHLPSFARRQRRCCAFFHIGKDEAQILRIEFDCT